MLHSIQATAAPFHAEQVKLHNNLHLEHIALINNHLCSGVLLCERCRTNNSKWHPALADDILAL